MIRVPIRTIIETWKACGQNSSEAARQLGIDRRTVKRWVDRGRQPWGYVRWRGVQRQSTAPNHSKRVLRGETAALVRRWREATGFCREKLAVMARSEGMEVSASTIHRYLHRVGLVRPSTKRRRPRFQKRLHAKCEEVGLEHFYIHKSSPNENAVIERSFRTDEEEFFFWLEKAPRDHLELNAWYQRFLDTYNTIRPHMGINMLTPKEAINLYQKP